MHLTQARVFARCRRIAALGAACSALAGCAGPEAPPDPTSPGTVTLDRILAASREAYQRVRSLEAVGVLRDFREGRRIVLPIRWDMAQPDRGRFQIGLNVALVLGDTWWTCDSSSGQFRKHTRFTSSPLETASYLVSDGVPFLLPALVARPAAVLSSSPRRPGDWRLLGVDWSGERQCYVIRRDFSWREGSGVLRVWIDQREHLLRAWDVYVPREGGGERVVLACSYHEMIINRAIPPDRFTLRPPKPLSLPEDQPATLEAAAP